MSLERVVVKGVAQWENLFKPNNLSHRYQIDICQLDKTSVKKLEEKGVEVKKGTGDKKNKGAFVVAKTEYQPNVTDAAKNAWPSSLKVGNGSKIKCSVSPYTWNNEYGTGISVALNSVMVVDFKEADMNGSGDLDAEEGGFVLSDLDEDDDIPFEIGDDL